MPDLAPPTPPEQEQVVLSLPDANGLEIKDFTSYTFNSNFLTPTDGWDFTIGTEFLSDQLQEALKPGVKVQLSVAGAPQAVGYIDHITIDATRDGGSQWHIGGRDVLAQACDACADPTQSLKEGMSLEDALLQLFKPFGWDSTDKFANSNDANRGIASSQTRHKSQRSEGKGFGRHAIKSYKLHQIRPYPMESVFQFASRLSQRQGLWIWPSADGKTLVVSQPDFDTDPCAKLLRDRSGGTNVLSGSVKRDLADQPTHLVCDGYSGGGEFGHSRNIVILANTVVECPDASSYLEKYINAGAKVLGSPTFPASSSMTSPRVRILYLHDDESADLAQLESFAYRELAKLQRKSLTVEYTVEGHSQSTPAGPCVWSVDTIVTVQDELAQLQEDLWVIGRTFSKSRSGGTTTRLELIRKNTLAFSDIGK